MGWRALVLLAILDELALLIAPIAILATLAVFDIVPTWAAVIGSAPLAAIAAWLTYDALRAPTRTHTYVPINKIGVADSELNPRGIVVVDGERWVAVSRVGRVERGSRVRVVGMDQSGVLIVEPI